MIVRYSTTVIIDRLYLLFLKYVMFIIKITHVFFTVVAPSIDPTNNPAISILNALLLLCNRNSIIFCICKGATYHGLSYLCRKLIIKWRWKININFCTFVFQLNNNVYYCNTPQNGYMWFYYLNISRTQRHIHHYYDS